MTSLIELAGVSKQYPPRKRKGDPVTAVRDVSLSVDAGEIVGIVGYSGAGKSTLVRLVNALEPVSSGSVVVDGVDITTLSERRLQQVRRGIGMIFQQFNLLSSRTVWRNIEYPLKVAGVPSSEHQRRISDLLRFVGLADKAHHYPEQLSGGQKQRVGIARALATNPSILLADEATSALDPETTSEVVGLLRRVNEELGITIVLITHEMDVARALAHRVVVMDAGEIVEEGRAFDVFARPRHPTTRRFVGTIVEEVPDERTAAELRARHDGRLVTLTFRDDSASQSRVFAELIEHGVEFELVYGGMQEVQGETFGHLTVVLRGSGTEAALRAIVGLGIETREVPSGPTT